MRKLTYRGAKADLSSGESLAFELSRMIARLQVGNRPISEA